MTHDELADRLANYLDHADVDVHQLAAGAEKFIGDVDGFATVMFEITPNDLVALKYHGQLPERLTLLDVFSIPREPELAQWREMIRARRIYRLLCLYPPVGASDLMAAVDSVRETPAEEFKDRAIRNEGIRARHHDYCTDALRWGLDELCDRRDRERGTAGGLA